MSVLTLPADNGTWGVGVIASAGDKAMRGLRDVGRWTAVVQSLPLAAHWLDGEPIEDRIVVMAKIEDRHRSFTVEGAPVATGVAAVADSYMDYGAGQIIVRTDAGYVAGSDPRRDGQAAGF